MIIAGCLVLGLEATAVNVRTISGTDFVVQFQAGLL